MKPLESLELARFDTPAILKKLAASSRCLAELKGLAASIPNQGILINNLFMHPYTKIEFVQCDLQISRMTATKYLEELVAGGFVSKQKGGRSNYYINIALNRILQPEQVQQ